MLKNLSILWSHPEQTTSAEENVCQNVVIYTGWHDFMQTPLFFHRVIKYIALFFFALEVGSSDITSL